MHLKLKKEKGRKDHMKTNIIFLSFLLSSVISLAETIIQLPESNIQSDYVEINKMKNLKNIIVIEKKKFRRKGIRTYPLYYKIFQTFMSEQPVGEKLIFEVREKDMQQKICKC